MHECMALESHGFDRRHTATRGRTSDAWRIDRANDETTRARGRTGRAWTRATVVDGRDITRTFIHLNVENARIQTDIRGVHRVVRARERRGGSCVCACER